MRVPTAPILTTNVSKTIKEVQESALGIFHSINPVVFHQDVPEFSSSVLPRGDEWPALLARANTDHVAPALTVTAALNPAAPEARGCQEQQNKFKLCTTNRQSNRVTQSALRPRQ